ncbi:MAG: MOSC domain-containing protein [Phycisphaerales bacterium]|nr:MOSC domain-containing protein [Phycisphaerales bacterium]
MIEPMHVVSVNISPGGIPKLAQPSCRVDVNGLAEDGHNHEKHRSPLQAVSLIDLEILDAMKTEGFHFRPGELGENLTLSGAAIQNRGLGDRLRFEHGLELEITKVRTPCYVLDSINPELKRIMWNRIGMYARVIVPGTVAADDSFEIHETGPGPRPATRTVPEGAIDGAAFSLSVLGIGTS